MTHRLCLLVVALFALAWSSSTAAAQSAQLTQTPAPVPGVSYPAQPPASTGTTGGPNTAARAPIDAGTYEEAEKQRRTGTGLMITGGVFGAGGLVALLLGALSYGAQNTCISPSGTCSRDVEPPIALLAGGGGSLFLGLTLILVGAVSRSAANEILEAPVSIGLDATSDGATVGLTGRF